MKSPPPAPQPACSAGRTAAFASSLDSLILIPLGGLCVRVVGVCCVGAECGCGLSVLVQQLQQTAATAWCNSCNRPVFECWCGARAKASYTSSVSLMH
jgi:ethanolamine utilization microcompartment shell protein EutL